jgi:hypothetical protein
MQTKFIFGLHQLDTAKTPGHEGPFDAASASGWSQRSKASPKQGGSKLSKFSHSRIFGRLSVAFVPNPPYTLPASSGKAGAGQKQWPTWMIERRELDRSAAMIPALEHLQKP